MATIDGNPVTGEPALANPTPTKTFSPMDKHTLALGAALGATGVEVYCVYDGLQNATGAQLAAGVAIAILAPLIPAYFEGARRYFAMVVFALALACVIVVSGSRVGGTIDRAQQAHDQADLAAKLAKQTTKDFETRLAEARTAATTACAAQKTKAQITACTDANNRVDGILGKLTAARTTQGAVPVVSGEGDVARVVAWTGGLLTEHQVSLYLPLLWPVTMALVGAFFWGVWGDGRPKTAPVVEQKPAKSIPTPAPQPQSASNVAIVLNKVLAPADRRKRLELAEIHRAYAEACRALGGVVANDDTFVA